MEDLKTVRLLKSLLLSPIVRNHVKLEIRSFVMNFNSEGFSLRVLYFMMDTGYGLGRSLGDCRPALPEGPSTKWLKQN